MALEITHSFPPEIIREILLRASVKSLLRCKSVCKDWYSLISDKKFIKSHLTLNTNNLKYNHHSLIYNIYEQENDLYNCSLYDVLFDKSAYNILRLKNPLQRNRGDLSIVGSCNGLVCLFVENVDEDKYGDEDEDEDEDDHDAAAYDLFIYNPSTRIWNRIPIHREYSESDWYSFGYDEYTDDYKIVEIMSTAREVNIYSLKSRMWKRIANFSYSDGPLKGCGIFSNGALHWVDYDEYNELSTKRIVSLDLESETFGEVLQPVYDEGPNEYEDGGLDGPRGYPAGRGRGRGRSFRGRGRGYYNNASRNFYRGGYNNGSCGRSTNLILGVLGESLCGLYYYSGSHADLWVMNVYGVKDSWTKLAFFSYLTDPWIDLNPVPLFLSNDGKVLIKCAQDVVIYKSKDDSFEYFDRRCKACVVVVESLVSPFPPFPPLALADNNEY